MNHRITATWLTLALAVGASPSALAGTRPAAHAAGSWHLDRVVLVMRHGVRPPTRPEPLPPTMTSAAWPAWDVGWGELTSHGARAVGLLGDYDRARYRGLLGSGCPAVRVVADIDERTVHTAAAYIAHLLPHCDVAIEHGAPGSPDPRFSPFESGAALSQDDVLAAARAALPDGDTAALDQRFADQYRAIDAITGCGNERCSIAAKSSTLAAPGGRAKLSGALALGASFAQTLALEYADGKPLADVGWGRATLPQITRLSDLHAAELAVTARPLRIARAGANPLLGEIRASLTRPSGTRFSLFVGHDSNLSWLGGALGLHWHVPQFAADDPPPGGALVFERWSNGAGHYRLRVLFRSQTLEQLRNLNALDHAAAPTTGAIACAKPQVCTLARLANALSVP